MSVSPPTAARPLAHWEPRVYPGALECAARLRRDVRTDLAGFPDRLVADVELCASELFANAVSYTATGAAGGRAVRSLALIGTDRLRLSVTDAGGAATRPRIPAYLGAEWLEAESRRGLLLVASLALDWGARPADTGPGRSPGLTVWADFPVSAVPPPPRPPPEECAPARGLVPS
ncbi:ATP-binding protein [Nocardiopsis composta]|uniref:Anti-sigma regulatory factor (Ser/Thr protein kinase) n=1 Tax=Nocardiopsis composta TaxID=157465 RepID=A0A7W8QJR0_9ACTN|nr:ATP-binding protein [Nocardiopsis composta]MBB5431671.1 anti-sigma regulatory factor (Ser/Thr protein kinase) [Nocardiopsis composta]